MTHEHLTDSIFGGESPEPARRQQRPQPPTTRREMHHGGRRRKKKPRGRKWIVLLVTVLLVGGAGYAAWSVLGPVVGRLMPGSSADEAIDFPGPGSGEVTVVVESGQTGEDIATTLKEEGVTKTRTAYLQAAAADPAAAAKIQAGSYSMLKGMTGADAFAYLIDPANRQAGVTIREGLWKSETFDALSKATGVPVADYEAAAKDTSAIGLPAEAGGNIEGWMFPSTYDFAQGMSATDQLKAMVAQTVAVLKAANVPQEKWEDTLTVASIIEGEVGSDTDRGKVARVILNRLKGGPPSYGLLQMDSTVHYVAQQRGKAGTTAEQRNSDSPYNTYKNPGLPPGPIGNPSKASIEAAANPTPGDWVFFVTVNPSTGETKFATTLAEHDQYVKEFQAWCSDNPGKC